MAVDDEFQIFEEVITSLDVTANDNGGVDRTGNVGTWVTHDLQVTYSLSTGTTIALGMQNAFEKEPELIPYDGRNYNFNLYDAYGRVSYIRFTQTF